MKINIGCGEHYFEDFDNLDFADEVKKDKKFHAGFEELPYEVESIDEVWCSHNLEHIEFKRWPILFFDIWNKLKNDGRVILVYPEFEKCAKYFLENKNGQRDFWRVALYGRQAYQGDYHVTPVVTTHLISYLQKWGFKDFKHGEEGPGQDYATMLTFKKGVRASKMDIFREFTNDILENF